MSVADLCWKHRGIVESVRVHNLGVMIRRMRGESWDAPENQYRNAIAEAEAAEASLTVTSEAA